MVGVPPRRTINSAYVAYKRLPSQAPAVEGKRVLTGVQQTPLSGETKLKQLFANSNTGQNAQGINKSSLKAEHAKDEIIQELVF